MWQLSLNPRLWSRAMDGPLSLSLSLSLSLFPSPSLGPNSTESMLNPEQSRTIDLVGLWTRRWGGGWPWEWTRGKMSNLAGCPRLRCITDLVQPPAWWGRFQILLLSCREGWALPLPPSQPFLEAAAETCGIINLVQGTDIFWTLAMSKISYHLVGKTPTSNTQQTGIKGHSIKL